MKTEGEYHGEKEIMVINLSKRLASRISQSTHPIMPGERKS
jgi:hypothetical protein